MATSHVRGHKMVAASFGVTVATLVAIVLIGLAFEAGTSRNLPEGGPATDWTVRLVRFAFIFGIPLVATTAPLLPRGRTAAIATRVVATVVLLLWSLLFAFSAIIGFLPAAVLMAIATAQAIVEDDPGVSKPVESNT